MGWQPSYATAADLAGWLGVNEDPQLVLAIDAASRAIDRATGRQFGATDAAETWHYPADFYRGTTIVDIDDTFDIDLTVTGAPTFTLYPGNPKGRPYTQIQVAGYAGPEVAVTAVWGWNAVPEAVKTATLIQAGRYLERRTNPSGPLSSERVDDIQRDWSATTGQEVDADVAGMITDYRKLWAVA